MPSRTKEVDPQAAVDEKIVQLRNDGAKWADIAEAVGLPSGKCMFRYDVATLPKKDRIANATAADVQRLRDEGVSWGKIAALTGYPESRARTLYEEAGGTALGHRIGKGGRYPKGADLNGEPRPAKKAAGSKKAAAPAKAVDNALVIELAEKQEDLAAVQDLITARALRLANGDVIKVRSVKAVKNGAVQVVDDETGKARAVKVANINQISKGKVKLQASA